MKKCSRRSFIRDAMALSVGIGGMGLNMSSPAGAAATPQRKKLPMGKIGKYNISRLIVGGNPFSFFAHSEPLIYCSELFKAYFTHEKVVETLRLCADNGINTHIGRIDDNVLGYLKLYEKTTGKRIQWIGQTAKFPYRGATKKELEENIKLAADNGAIGCFLQGGSADAFVAAGDISGLEYFVSFIKKQGMFAGLGAHLNKTVEAVIRAGIEVDFFMKTFNKLSFNAPDYERTSELMPELKAPWIAFKVLAAGRIHPREGFKAALEAGADFLNVGMFDFQVAEDAKLFSGIYAKVAGA